MTAPPRDPRPNRVDPRLLEAMDLLDRVARGVARQLGGRYHLDDLKGFAHEALAALIGKYDPARNASFRSYARLRLRGAIIDGLRRESGLPRGVAARLRALEAADLYTEGRAEETAPRSPNAELADARLQNLLAGLATAYATGLVAHEETAAADEPRENLDPELQAHRAQARSLLERAIDDLGDPDATLLRRHYFLDEDLQDAAAHLGLSKSWGSRLHARAIAKLATRLASLRGRL